MKYYKKYMLFVIILVVVICFLVVMAFLFLREKKFRIVCEEPVTVLEVHGDKSSLVWGEVQFPKLFYSADGCVVCKIANKSDSVSSYEGNYVYYCLSEDGNTWEKIDDNTLTYEYSLLMDNGCYFQGATLVNGYKSNLTEKYTPEFINGSLQLFYADNIADEDFSKTFECSEYDPISRQENRFTSRFIWPYMPVRVVNGVTLPIGSCMNHFNMHNSNSIIKENDGNLLMAVYSQGFNSITGEVQYGGHYNVYLFRSSDNARTWNYVSQILTEPVYCSEEKEGFSEPCLSVTNDGSYIILMRTGTNAPCYIAHSADKGSTWTSIRQFSNVGVDPQLCSLNNGIIIASYGRPGLYIRGTNDEHSYQWDIPICILKPDSDSEDYFKDSCCYSSLLYIDDNTALLAYSKFEYPDGYDADKIVKSILVRKIKIEYYWVWKDIFE